MLRVYSLAGASPKQGQPWNKAVPSVCAVKLMKISDDREKITTSQFLLLFGLPSVVPEALSPPEPPPNQPELPSEPEIFGLLFTTSTLGNAKRYDFVKMAI